MGRFKEPDELKTSNRTQKNNGESNKQIDNGKTHWKKNHNTKDTLNGK